MLSMRACMRVFVVLAALAALLIAGAVPAAAASPSGSTAVGAVYGRFHGPEVRGVALVHLIHGDSATFTSALVGLEPGVRYRFLGASKGCAVVDASDFTVWRTGFMAHPAFHVGTVAGGVWKSTRSVRLVKEGAGTVACVRAHVQSIYPLTSTSIAAEQPKADGAFVTFGGGPTRGIALVELVATHTARVTSVLRGLEPGHDYTGVGATVPCTDDPGPGQRPLKYTFNDVLVESFTTKKASLDSEGIEALRSIRVRDTDGTPWGCQTTNIIGVLIGL